MSVITVIIKILIAIVVFGMIIFVHEFGHFIMARLMGVRVLEFALGMGPKLIRFKGKETEYSLRLFPIGGFCSMAGEDAAGGGAIAVENADANADIANDPRAFCNKKVWRRILIVIAGAVMNLILGFALLLVYFGAVYTPEENGEVIYRSTAIAQLGEETPAYKTGLRAGDTILSIDGQRVFSNFDIASMMQSDEDGVMDMVVRREVDGDKTKVKLDDVKFELTVDEETGTRYLRYDFAVYGIRQNVWSTIEQAGRMEASVSLLVWRSLGDLISGDYGLNELSGPVGTVDAIGDAAIDQSDKGSSINWEQLVMMGVIVTVNVGIFNLLPIPALDGGRLMFLVIEGVTRKKVPEKFEGMVHVIGFVLLLLLMVVVTFSDIIKLFA